VLLVEQNAHAALSIADRAYVLENGRIGAMGSAQEMLSSSAVQDAYLGGDAGQFAMERRIRNSKRAILGR
jgi:ABC-type lipopolysaccharide export system ATPase subunit